VPIGGDSHSEAPEITDPPLCGDKYIRLVTRHNKNQPYISDVIENGVIYKSDKVRYNYHETSLVKNIGSKPSSH
jgi:hypothetical protein